MSLLTFDLQHQPRQARINMALLLALMIAFPFFASQYGNSWCASSTWRCCTSCWPWA